MCWTLQNNIITQQGAFVYFRPLRKLTKGLKSHKSPFCFGPENTNAPLGIKIIQSASRSSNICQCECFHLESKHKLAKVRKPDFTTRIQFSKEKKIGLLSWHLLFSNPWKKRMSVVCVLKWFLNRKIRTVLLYILLYCSIVVLQYCTCNYREPKHLRQHNKEKQQMSKTKFGWLHWKWFPVHITHILDNIVFLSLRKPRTSLFSNNVSQ